MSAVDSTLSGKILELRRALPWVGDQLNAEDTIRTSHAITSMLLAFALYADIDGERLPELMLTAVNAQRGRTGSAAIEQGFKAVLDALER